MIRVQRDTVWYPWICWLIAATVFLVQYGLLGFPSTIIHQLQESLSIGDVGIGILFSSFLYTYVLMQVPVGFLYDRYNASTLLLCATIVLGLGCVSMIFSNNLASGVISRMLMGFGGSFGFIGAIYLGRSWFSATMFPVIVGLTEAMSGVGSIGFNYLFATLTNIQRWQITLAEILAFIIVLCVLIKIFIREKQQKSHSTVAEKRLNEKTKVIFKNKVVWLAAFYIGFGFVHFMVLTNMFFGGFGILISPLIGYLYHVSSNNVSIAVFPIVLCSGISVLFCLALLLKKGRMEVS